MTAPEVTLRPASNGDHDCIAAVFSASLESMDHIPRLHGEASEHWFVGNILLQQCAVTVAEADDGIRGFLARQREEVRLLHVHPVHFGRGTGSALLTREQRACESVNGLLFLWCFQANSGARRFYERHGFTAVEFTDGARNEEKLPDVRYEWRPSMSESVRVK